MAFSIDETLKRILAELGIAEAAAIAKLEEVIKNYPDIAGQVGALRDLLLSLASGTLDPAKIRNTLEGVAKDLLTGRTGVDPGAWTGSV